MILIYFHQEREIPAEPRGAELGAVRWHGVDWEPKAFYEPDGKL